MQTLQSFLGSQWPPYAYTAFRILLVLVGGLVAVVATRGAVQRLRARLEGRAQAAGGVQQIEDGKRIETLARLLEQSAVIGIWVVAVIVVLGQVGVAVGPLLAGAGIAGVAIGFGAQALVRDVISGFFLILENQVRVGDVATVNGKTGTVENITLRTIVLRDASGTVHVFPNGTVATLSNLTSGWSAYVLEMGVSYTEDTDRVVEVMREVGAELKADSRFGAYMVADAEVMGVERFEPATVVIKSRLKTLPGKHMEVGREYNRRVKKAFEAKGIAMK